MAAPKRSGTDAAGGHHAGQDNGRTIHLFSVQGRRGWASCKALRGPDGGAPRSRLSAFLVLRVRPQLLPLRVADVTGFQGHEALRDLVSPHQSPPSLG